MGNSFTSLWMEQRCFTMNVIANFTYSSWLVIIFRCFSLLDRPKIFLKTLLSKTISRNMSYWDEIQVSDAYMNTGLIVLFILHFISRQRNLDAYYFFLHNNFQWLSCWFYYFHHYTYFKCVHIYMRPFFIKFFFRHYVIFSKLPSFNPLVQSVLRCTRNRAQISGDSSQNPLFYLSLVPNFWFLEKVRNLCGSVFPFVPRFDWGLLPSKFTFTVFFIFSCFTFSAYARLKCNLLSRIIKPKLGSLNSSLNYLFA